MQNLSAMQTLADQRDASMTAIAASLHSRERVGRCGCITARNVRLNGPHHFAIVDTAGMRCVTKAPGIIRNEPDLTMAFCGHTKIKTVDQLRSRAGCFPLREARQKSRGAMR